jgi:hypothetical protein
MWLLQVQELLAGASNPSAIVDAVPMLLDAKVLSAVLQEMQRLFGANSRPLQLLQRNPALALMCESLQQQSRGDRDADDQIRL